MLQRLRYRKICIVKLYIFPHKSDPDFLLPALDLFYQCRPFLQIAWCCFKGKLPAHDRREVGFFEHQRGFIEIGQGDILNHTVRFHITEHGNLVLNGILQRFITPEHDDIRIDSHSLQFLYGVLGRFGLVFFGATQIWHECHMNK